jgi:hypothetical protein
MTKRLLIASTCLRHVEHGGSACHCRHFLSYDLADLIIVYLLSTR